MQKMSPIKRTYTGEDKSDADRTILTDNPRRSSDYYSIRQKKNFKSIQQIQQEKEEFEREMAQLTEKQRSEQQWEINRNVIDSLQDEVDELMRASKQRQLEQQRSKSSKLFEIEEEQSVETLDNV